MPRTGALQHASHFAFTERSYGNKYPGDTATAMHAVCQELIERLAPPRRPPLTQRPATAGASAAV